MKCRNLLINSDIYSESYYLFMTNKEIEKNGWVLTPGRYVGSEEIEEDGVPFQEKFEKLKHELFMLFDKGLKLTDEIKKNLI